MRVAEAQLWAGMLDDAVATARATIEVCRTALRGNLEADALGVLALALLRRGGISGLAEAGVALDQADGLFDRTGAETDRPNLLEWRAEAATVKGEAAVQAELLVQAAVQFAAIGARLQAERIRTLLPQT